MHYGDTLLPEAYWSSKTLLAVALLVYKIIVEVSIIGEGNILSVFPAIRAVVFVQS